MKDGDHGQIQKAASAIIAALSKRHNSTVMLAVVEVKVETQVDSLPIGESHVPAWAWLTGKLQKVDQSWTELFSLEIEKYLLHFVQR